MFHMRSIRRYRLPIALLSCRISDAAAAAAALSFHRRTTGRGCVSPNNHPTRRRASNDPTTTSSPRGLGPTTSRERASWGDTTGMTRASSSGASTSDVVVRILCLHGKGGTGTDFVNRSLMPLRSMVEGRTYAMNHDNDADDDAAECGGNNDGSSIISVEWDCLTAPYALDDGGGGYSWWTMPSGVRSYNAMEYEGFEESERMVIDGIFPKSNNDRCAYDIILAHSQGAILMSAILSMRERLWNGGGGGRPYGYILNGCAWPNPYGYSLSSMADGRISGIIDDDDDDPSSSLPRVLFVMGREDVINPIDSAMRVHDAYRDAKFDASIAMHDGGHSVPMGKDGDSARALGEVVDWIVGIARRKASSRCG